MRQYIVTHKIDPNNILRILYKIKDELIKEMGWSVVYRHEIILNDEDKLDPKIILKTYYHSGELWNS